MRLIEKINKNRLEKGLLVKFAGYVNAGKYEDVTKGMVEVKTDNSLKLKYTTVTDLYYTDVFEEKMTVEEFINWSLTFDNFRIEYDNVWKKTFFEHSKKYELINQYNKEIVLSFVDFTSLEKLMTFDILEKLRIEMYKVIELKDRCIEFNSYTKKAYLRNIDINDFVKVR